MTRMEKQRRIEKRIIKEADMLLCENLTIRQIAKRMKVSKSTVHRDLTTMLVKVYPGIQRAVRAVLNQHIDERASKGGQAHAAACARRKLNR